VVVRANNQAPPQYYYVIQNGFGGGSVDGGVSLFNHHQPGHLGGVGTGNAGQTIYAVVANQGQSDLVVTNDQVLGNNVGHQAVNFENLRPGNVRRLEEPSSEEHVGGEEVGVEDVHGSPLAPRDSFDEPANGNNGKTNFHQDEQQQQQEEQVEQEPQAVKTVVRTPQPVKTPPPVKSAPEPVKTPPQHVRVFVAPVKAPPPPRPFVLTRVVQEPEPVKTVQQQPQNLAWRFGNRRLVHLQSQQVQNYGTKTAAPAPVKTPPAQQSEQQVYY